MMIQTNQCGEVAAISAAAATDPFDPQALTDAWAAQTAGLPLLERAAARDFAAGIPPETTAEQHRCQPEEIRAALARARQALGEAGLANRTAGFDGSTVTPSWSGAKR